VEKIFAVITLLIGNAHTIAKVFEAVFGAASFFGFWHETPPRAPGDWKAWELESRVENYPQRFDAHMVR
jgi:hypothetical protein